VWADRVAVSPTEVDLSGFGRAELSKPASGFDPGAGAQPAMTHGYDR